MRKGRIALWAGAVAAVLGSAIWAGLRLLPPRPLTLDTVLARQAAPLPAPQGPVSVYHLGHSLVGRDMPAMLAQLTPGHRYDSQLGWGASLQNHQQGKVPGMAEENAHPRHRPAAPALAAGDYDVVVLTEMVELRDAIRWHDSARALAHWARAAQAGNPQVRLYLYETWHRLDDPAGWLARIDADLPTLWQGDLVARAMADPDMATIRIIPGGQVMAAVVRAAEAGQIPGLTRREDLFARAPDGTLDPIHLNDFGHWLIAMAHFAVIYQQSPVGLPAALRRADGSPATAPAPDTARALQQVVWRVVTGYAGTGVGQTGAGQQEG